MNREESDKKIETLESSLDQKQKDLNDVQRTIKKMEMKYKKELQELSLQVETLKVESQHKTSENKELQLQLVEKEEKILQFDSLKKEYEKLKEEFSELQKENQSSESDLQENLEIYKVTLQQTTMQALHEKQQKITQLETQCEKLFQELNTNSITEENATLKGSFASLQKEVQLYQERNQELQNHIKSLEQILESTKTDFQSQFELKDQQFSDKFNLIEKNHQKYLKFYFFWGFSQIQKFLAEILSLEEKLKQVETTQTLNENVYQKEIKKLENDIVSTKDKEIKTQEQQKLELDKLFQRSLQEKDKEYKEAKEKMDLEIEKARDDYKRIFASCDSQKKLIQQLQSNESSKNAEIRNLQEKMDQLTQKCSEQLQIIELKVPQYEQRIEELTQNINNYRASMMMLSRKESLSNESPDKGSDTQNLAKQLQELNFNEQGTSGDQIKSGSDSSEMVEQRLQRISPKEKDKRSSSVAEKSKSKNLYQNDENKLDQVLKYFEKYISQQIDQIKQQGVNNMVKQDNKTSIPEMMQLQKQFDFLMQTIQQKVELTQEALSKQVQKYEDQTEKQEVTIKKLLMQKSQLEQSVLDSKEYIKILENKRILYENMISDFNQQLINQKNKSHRQQMHSDMLNTKSKNDLKIMRVDTLTQIQTVGSSNSLGSDEQYQQAQETIRKLERQIKQLKSDLTSQENMSMEMSQLYSQSMREKEDLQKKIQSK